MNMLEKKIQTLTEELNGKNIKVMLDNFLTGKINFDNVNINYDNESGFLKFVSNENCLEFNTIDIKLLNNDAEKVEIDLDNSQNIKILKK